MIPGRTSRSGGDSRVGKISLWGAVEARLAGGRRLESVLPSCWPCFEVEGLTSVSTRGGGQAFAKAGWWVGVRGRLRTWDLVCVCVVGGGCLQVGAASPASVTPTRGPWLPQTAALH